MISVVQAQQGVIDAAARYNSSRTQIDVLLLDALGRVCAADVLSPIQVPPTDNSAMDGFAVRSADVRAGVQLPISMRIPAGSQPGVLEPQTAARIFTGGVMPQGADAVVIQENCEYQQHDPLVTFNVDASPGDNVRPRGQDIQAGALVAKAGQRLSAIDLGLIASVGAPSVMVYPPIRVAIFSTGNELAEPGQTLTDGQIYNSNRTTLIALCQQLGYQVIDCGIVEDTLDATKQAMLEAAEQADLIVSSGGVSVGEEDHIKPAVQALGSLDMWKVQMKPGKPVAFGQVAATPFLGLPGNPVSSFVVFQLLALPLMATLQGEAWQAPVAYPVTSGFEQQITSREEYIRVRLERDAAGQLLAQRFGNLSSGVLSSLSWADGLVRQNIDQSISVGDKLEFLPFNQGQL